MTILSFQGQFKRAYDFYGVLESVAMWLLPFLMVKSPAASLKTRMIPKKDSEQYWYDDHEVEGKKHIFAYVEAVSYLLNAYATDGVISKADAEFKAFKYRPGQTAVIFAEAHEDEAMRCGDAFSEQHPE